MAVFAQDSQLTLDRIFKSGDFRSESFGPAKWTEGGKAYTTLESSTEFPGKKDIVEYQAKSGDRVVLVSASKLVPSLNEQPLTIKDYQWSHNKKYLLIYTNVRRVWRDSTRGDYWIKNLSSGSLRQLGKDLPVASLMFAKFSPDDTRVAYVSGHNIYVEDIEGGQVTALTTNGSAKLINGTFDWAYEEEFQIQDGFRWSPDGTMIAYWQLDASEIRDFLMINNTDSVYSYTIPLQYPKVGEDPSSCRIGVVSASGGETAWIPVPGDSKQNYLPRMMWSPDSESVLVQQIPRKQNTNNIWSYDIAAQSVEKVYTDKDDAWVRAINDWIWLDHGKQFSFISEKTGWQHFYRVHVDGSGDQAVTSGEFDVISIELIDSDNGYVYFIASPDNPTQRYLYRTRLNGSGKPQRLSPEDQPGDHSYQVAPGGKFAIHRYSTANTPPVIDLIALPSHKSLRTLADNEKFISNLHQLDKNPIEFFNITTETGVSMDGYMLRPTGFDESRKYPIIFYVYGEPAGQTARDRWGGARTLWHMMLAQQGYIVVTMDNRGSPSPKGRDWRKALYRNIGIINVEDQAMGAKEILKLDYVDDARVAVWGWSGGGSMTLNLLFHHPEIYQTGMSIAPVGNQLLYDNIYQERYMGVPWETKEDFIKGSPVTHASKLEGNLLLIHGTGDDNVHYQNSEVVINELIKHNKQFEMFSYPNRTHAIKEGKNTTSHLYGLLTKYLREHVEPGGKANTELKRDQ
ncbi:MAG: peptidase S9 [Cyclobacteriaceae bacterium]|nr:MAG: peptidase S9 [Cyclobacteriaceae bacterium]